MGLIALFSYGLLGFIYIRASPPSSLFPNLYLAGLFLFFYFLFFFNSSCNTTFSLPLPLFVFGIFSFSFSFSGIGIFFLSLLCCM